MNPNIEIAQVALQELSSARLDLAQAYPQSVTLGNNGQVQIKHLGEFGTIEISISGGE